LRASVSPEQRGKGEAPLRRNPDSAAAILEHILLIALIAISAITGVKAMSTELNESLYRTMEEIDATSGFHCGGWGEPPCP
jgi:Flp pilus assembly pilin Flp